MFKQNCAAIFSAIAIVGICLPLSVQAQKEQYLPIMQHVLSLDVKAKKIITSERDSYRAERASLLARTGPRNPRVLVLNNKIKGENQQINQLTAMIQRDVNLIHRLKRRAVKGK